GVGGEHPQTVFYVTNGSLLIRDITIIGSEDHSQTTLFELYGTEGQIKIISCNTNSQNDTTEQQLPMIKVVVGKSIYISQSHFTGGVFSDTAVIVIENSISELIIDQSTFSNNDYDIENKGDGIILDDKLGKKRRIFIKDSQFTGPLDEDDSQMHGQNNDDDNQICNQGSLSIYVTRGTINIYNSLFIRWRSGSISVEGSEARVIIICDFFLHNNNSLFSDYLNLRRNILCIGRAFVKYDPNHFIGDDDQQNPSKWIYSNDNDCILQG
ncbi:MAG: hypothetical protein EZS28_042124, partial [Streblomastix strix]